MKRLLLPLFLLLPLLLPAQEEVRENITIVDDESCGCELFFVDSIQTTKRNGLFGFKLADGRELFPAIYKYVDQWHGNFCKAYSDDTHLGMLDRQGRELVPPIYDEVDYPFDGMIRFKKDGYYGFYDTTGQLVLPPIYGSVSIFSEGMAVLMVDDTVNLVTDYVYIDHQGHTVMQGDWQYAYPFFNGYAVVKKYDRYGLIDPQGRERVPFQHEFLSGVDANGIFLANNPHGEGVALYSTRNFKPLTSFQYDYFINYGEGFYTFQRGDKQGYIDTLGRERFGLWEVAAPFQHGYSAVSLNDKWGIIDNEGHSVLPVEYDFSDYCNSCYVFQEGLALVCREGKFGFCDEAGHIVIPFLYDGAFPFSSQRAAVKKDGMWGFIDPAGETAIPFIFHAATPFEYGRAEVFYNGFTSKITPDGKCVKACENYPKF